MQADELKRRFGQRIQALRENAGLTQEQLADRIGRSVDTLGNIERGVNSTRIETAYLLADELGVRLPTLFDLEDREAGEKALALAEIVRLLEACDLRMMRAMKALIESGLGVVAAAEQMTEAGETS